MLEGTPCILAANCSPVLGINSRRPALCLILASMVVVSNRIELRVPHPIPKKNISHMKADPMFIAK